MPDYLYGLYNWLLWDIAFVIAYKTVVQYNRNGMDGYVSVKYNRSTFRFLFVLFLFYSLFTFFGGDKTGYEHMVVESGLYGTGTFINMEPVYVYLGMLVKGDFLVWKLIVYGCALLLVYLSTKRMKLDSVITLSFFIGFALISYGSTRAVLAYALYLFGLSFLRERNVLSLLIGVLLVLGSYFFHNSMLPIILLTPLVYVKLNKKRLIFLILAFPVIVQLFNLFADQLFMQIDTFSNEYDQEHLQNKFSAYTDEDTVRGSRLALHQIVQKILDWAIVIPIFWHSFRLYFDSKLSRKESVYLLASFYILYLSLVLRFSSLFNSTFMFVRYFGLFPFILFMMAVPLYNSDKLGIRGLRTILLTMAIRQNYLFALMLYHAM